jgi:hypothetical protein
LGIQGVQRVALIQEFENLKSLGIWEFDNTTLVRVMRQVLDGVPTYKILNYEGVKLLKNTFLF